MVVVVVAGEKTEAEEGLKGGREDVGREDEHSLNKQKSSVDKRVKGKKRGRIR